MDQPNPPHNRRLGAEIHGLTADIDVAVVDHSENLGKGQAIGDELIAVDIDVVGLGLAAPSRDVDHPRHGLEPPFQHPVLQGLQVGN